MTTPTRPAVVCDEHNPTLVEIERVELSVRIEKRLARFVER